MHKNASSRMTRNVADPRGWDSTRTSARAVSFQIRIGWRIVPGCQGPGTLTRSPSWIAPLNDGPRISTWIGDSGLLAVSTGTRRNVQTWIAEGWGPVTLAWLDSWRAWNPRTVPVMASAVPTLGQPTGSSSASCQTDG